MSDGGTMTCASRVGSQSVANGGASLGVISACTSGERIEGQSRLCAHLGVGGGRLHVPQSVLVPEKANRDLTERRSRESSTCKDGPDAACSPVTAARAARADASSLADFAASGAAGSSIASCLERS
jgi:hypothetical protein